MSIKKGSLIVSVTLIFLAIIVLVPALGGSWEDAGKVRTVKDFDRLGLALTAFTFKQGWAPSADEGLGALVGEGLLKHLPHDYIDRPYSYLIVGQNPIRFIIWSEASLTAKSPIFAALFTWQDNTYYWHFIDSIEPYQ